MTTLELPLLLRGCACIGPVLLALSLASLGFFLPVQSAVWAGSALSVLDLAQLGLPPLSRGVT